MKILSLCSSIINSKLEQDNLDLDILGEEYIVSQLYSQKAMDDKYDYIVFDLLPFLKEYIINQNMIKFKENNVDEKNVKVLENKEVVFEAVIEILINDLVGKNHISKIILLNIEIDENLKYVDNKFIDTDLNDKENIRANNKLLKDLYNKVIKNSPGISPSEAIKVYYCGIDKGYEVEESILIKLNFKQLLCPNEKMHRSLKNIRYYFEDAKLFNKNKLIVIFSAFSQEEPKYNYVKTLKAIDCNKLYILDDYGEKGSYYLGLDGNFDVESSVMSLITKVMNEKNILFKDVISLGSSKGGSAALYYGFKYNFKEVIVGAPQYKIGTYLMDLSIKTYGKDIFGELTEGNRIKYDNLIRKVILNNSSTKVSILTSDGDQQYVRVLKDIELVLKQNNVDFKIDKCEINHHNEIAKFFTTFSYEKLSESLNGKGCINNKFINEVNKRIKGLKLGGSK